MGRGGRRRKINFNKFASHEVESFSGKLLGSGMYWGTEGDINHFLQEVNKWMTLFCPVEILHRYPNSS